MQPGVIGVLQYLMIKTDEKLFSVDESSHNQADVQVLKKIMKTADVKTLKQELPNSKPEVLATALKLHLRDQDPIIPFSFYDEILATAR